MQLKNKPGIAAALATASCALLGQPAMAETQDNEWQFDTAIMYYGESDRVQLVEGVFNANKDFGDEHIFNGKLVIDTLTGASATGAVPQPGVQTFTRPSGNGQYQIDASELPLDDTFRDTRVQADVQWTQPLTDNLTGSGGLHLSNEYDYLSAAINGSLSYDLNQNNTTLTMGLSYAHDEIDPVGGRPRPFASMVIADPDQFGGAGNANWRNQYQQAFDDTRLAGSDTKDTLDLLFGVTQVINRRMLMQFNYSYSRSEGYHTDPYKLLSVVNDNGLTQALLHESRPEERSRHSVFLQTKYALDSGVVDLSYRYATDDWDIDSHTIESRFRIDLSDNSYIQPHFRYYQQGAAEFFMPFMMENEPLPDFASADYRLGEMDAFTVGLKYGMTLDNGDELAFRLEYYQQNPTNAGFDAPGVLQNEDLYPSVKAVIAQVSYRF